MACLGEVSAWAVSYLFPEENVVEAKGDAHPKGERIGVMWASFYQTT